MGTLKSVCSSWFALLSRDIYENSHLRVPNLLSRAVVSGGAGGAFLGVLLTLFQPEGAHYANPITASTPGFQNLTTALLSKYGFLWTKLSYFNMKYTDLSNS